MIKVRNVAQLFNLTAPFRHALIKRGGEALDSPPALLP
jgi:hypothetical protein